ncbi:hypothetical protein L7F22_061971 [Adiantum nelumboides]|nr:hypothetical protein [Adiantum nelumboides]
MASQSDKYPHIQLYKAGYIWQYLYQATTAGNLSPPRPLAITLARELEDVEGSIGVGKRLLEGPTDLPGQERPKLIINPPVPPVTDLVPLTKPISVDILDSPVRSPRFNITDFQPKDVETTRLLLKEINCSSCKRTALVNEAIVSYLGDLDNKSDEEGDDDDEDKADEDHEDPAGSSGANSINMVVNNEESRINVDNFDFAREGANDDIPMLVNYLSTRLQQAMANPALQGEVHQQLHIYGLFSTHQEERAPVKSLDSQPSRRRAHAPHEEPPSKEKERSKSLDDSMEKNLKEKKERKRSPSSQSSSPSSSLDESPRRGHRRSHATWKRSNKLKKFKEGGKSIFFLTYDDTFGATDKVLAFIQLDATFGDEGFMESSKLCHVAMHFQNPPDNDGLAFKLM